MGESLGRNIGIYGMNEKRKRNGINKRFNFSEWAEEQAKYDRALDPCWGHLRLRPREVTSPIRKNEPRTLVAGMGTGTINLFVGGMHGSAGIVTLAASTGVNLKGL